MESWRKERVLDVIIRGGQVVDGSGAPAQKADIGIKGERIVDVGELDADAGTVVDAAGRFVAPGFVDVHTHYDAQVFWDGALTPSPLHGVTTAFAGNCGFTIAPLSGRSEDAQYLMRMLARVEGMPVESLREGVPWNWKTTAEYLEQVKGRLAINAGFMVGHSALRRAVMGAESVARHASSDEVRAMQRLLRDGLEAGGIGFSSSWGPAHHDAEGNKVPSRHASRQELLDLCRVAGEYEGTSLEFIASVGHNEPWAIELMADMSVAGQRILNWNALGVTAARLEECRDQLAGSDFARQRGGRVVALTVPTSSAMRINFVSGFLLDMIPGWDEIMFLPYREKLALFADPAFRARMKALAEQPPPSSLVASLVNWAGLQIFDVVAVENEQYKGRKVGDIAREERRDPWEVLSSIALADDLRTCFGPLPAPVTDEDWKARVEVWRDGRAVIGASDAGAHLDMITSFTYPTSLIAETVRSRQLLPMEEAIHLLTDVPARLYGLVERGRVAKRWYADLVVLDPATVGSGEVEMRYDLPGGAGRLYGEAKGIDHVLVNGSFVVRDGRLVQESAGHLLRSGRDTRTPSIE
jgi:N-acyl-D-aspartate/D-glutamate deacylase